MMSLTYLLKPAIQGLMALFLSFAVFSVFYLPLGAFCAACLMSGSFCSSLLFLAHLYECTGRALSLVSVSDRA